MNKSKQIKGKAAYEAGLAAEKMIGQYYASYGYKILEYRYKTQYGEIDIITYKNSCLIFIEVKSRKNITLEDNPISKKQWTRLQNTATEYLANNSTKLNNPEIRFDVALTDHIGNIKIIKNAHSFDEW